MAALFTDVRLSEDLEVASLDDEISDVRHAFRSKYDRSEPSYGPWVLEVFDDHIIVELEDEGEYYSIPYTKDGDDNITFAERGAWTKVEKAYVPITENLQVVEAKKGDDTGEGKAWEVVIIGPEGEDGLVDLDGVSYIRSRNGRLYSAAGLEASAGLWEGIKVYDNHLTDEEFQQKKGMRSVVTEWVGVIVDTYWDAAANAIKGTLKVVDATLRQKLKDAKEAGVLDSIGLSIDALGTGRMAKIAGQAMQVVEKITKAISVDVVADPAAGGRLARMLASAATQTEVDMEKLLEQLKELLGERFAAMEAALKEWSEEQLQEMIDKMAAEAVVADPVEPKADPVAPVEPAAKTDAEPVSAEAQAIVDEAKKLLDEAKAERALAAQERQLVECSNLLVEKLGSSGLIPMARSLIADRYAKRVFEAADLDTVIEKAQGEQENMTQSGDIRVKETYHISGGFQENDRFELSLMGLVAGGSGLVEKIADDCDNVIYRSTEVGHSNITALEHWKEAGKPQLPKPRGLASWFYNFIGDDDPYRLLETETTSSMTSIVKNTVNLLLAHDYSEREQWWNPIVLNRDVASLDDTTLVRLMGMNTLSVVPEGAVYTELDWSDEEETASYVKRGNFLAVTLETFLQDKLNALRNIPQRLATSWWNTISDHVSNVFTVNSDAGPVLASPDSGALFNATALATTGGHANLLTTGLSYAQINTCKIAMRKNTDQALGAGRRLGIAPRYLLIPVDLEPSAMEIRNSELYPNADMDSGTGGQTKNILQGTFDYIVVPPWTDTNNWALVADPSSFPAIQLLWLRGRRTPELFTARDETGGAMFTNDVLRFKVRLFHFRFSSTYDCAPVSDFRPLHKSNVGGG